MPYDEMSAGAAGPAGLADLLGGGGAAPGMMGPNGAPEEPAPEEEELSPEEHLRQALDHIQKAQVGEPDDADSQKLAKTASDLYAIIASRQDAEMTASGGNPKQLRALGRSYGSQ